MEEKFMRKLFLIVFAVILLSPSCGADSNVGEVSSDEAAVIYFSATGNTERVATELSVMLDISLIEIEPAVPYTSEDLDYTDSNSRSTLESNDDSARPEILPLEEVGNYETVFIGFPIWNGDMPKVIYTFFDTYDFAGKTIIPFCTSGGSGISRAERNIAALEENAEILSGKRINTSRIQSDLDSWLDELGVEI